MAGLLALALIFISALTTLVHAGPPYCLPGADCFPAESALQSFNSSIDGRLIKSTPYGLPCYQPTFDAEACQALTKRKGDFEYRINQPAGVMFTNWELNNGEGCPVPDPIKGATVTAAVEGSCSLGGMPAYTVNATTEAHIVAAVDFAAKWNLRLRIKNTGHDYSGRSSGAGAFSIWTHHLNNLNLIKDFRPCYSSTSQTIISAEPGVTVGELYDFAGQNGVLAMAGYTSTIGVAGGFILGGGIGPLGDFLGMGVDNVVQFELITANGKKRIANECRNKELFWALRGGGSAFGVTTRVYFKTYPALQAVNTVSGTIGCLSNAAYRDLITKMVDLQVPLRNAGITGLWTSQNSMQAIAMLWIQPFLHSSDTILHPNETLKALQPILEIPGCKPTLQPAIQFPNWTSAYNTIIWPVVKAGAPVGTNVINFSRLISYDVMNDVEKLSGVKDYILGLSGDLRFIWQNSIGEASRKVGPHDTAVHPEWRNAFAYMNTPIAGPWTGPSASQNATAFAVLANATAVFGTAAYYNEDAVLEPDWRVSSWGANYKQLSFIKRMIDPKGVFACRGCVGSERGY